MIHNMRVFGALVAHMEYHRELYSDEVFLMADEMMLEDHRNIIMRIRDNIHPLQFDY